MGRMIAVDEDYLERLEISAITVGDDAQLLSQISYWQEARKGRVSSGNQVTDLAADVLREEAYQAGLPAICARCGTPLTESGRCEDITCPFHDHAQSCPMGWYAHPEHPGRLKCNCRG